MNAKRFEKNAGRLSQLAAAALLMAALAGAAAAQVSTDPENPTPMSASVVTGKSNGKARTHYYSFIATAEEPGEVRVKVTASTDERSTNMRVNFLDEDGQRVMDELYLIPKRDPESKVARHTFAERQKVVVRVTLPDDPQVRLLNYKIEVSGAVGFESAPATQTDTPSEPPADAPPDLSAARTEGAAQGDSVQQAAQTVETQGRPGQSLGRRVKDRARKAGSEVLGDLLKDNPY